MSLIEDIYVLLANATPGPWEQGAKNRYVISPSGPSFDWIATVQVSNVPKWEHNARLIAEAPTKLAEAASTLEAQQAALEEATACLIWIANLGYEGVPDIAMRKAARETLAKMAALNHIQPVGDGQ